LEIVPKIPQLAEFSKNFWILQRLMRKNYNLMKNLLKSKLPKIGCATGYTGPLDQDRTISNLLEKEIKHKP
jgi:hypothetical protein